MIGYIYAWVKGDDTKNPPTVWYVGKTRNGILKRIQEYLSCARHENIDVKKNPSVSRAIAKWIRAERKRGYDPIMVVLEVVSFENPDELLELERRYIEDYSAKNYAILNTNHGNNGKARWLSGMGSCAPPIPFRAGEQFEFPEFGD